MDEGWEGEDNARHRLFLLYCEERRQESKQRQEDDEERMRIADRKRNSWDMLRVSMEFLRKNDTKWQTRKIEEVDRIKEEEKTDRMAIC